MSGREQDAWVTRETLIKRVRRQRDQAAWEEFVYYYRGYVYNIGRRMGLTHHDAEEVVRYITSRDRPLAIYPFTNDRALQDLYINRVMSGGVSVNEGVLHVGQHDLPFGGVGGSGMGHYHGYEGFVTFSKLRPVFYQAPFSPIQMMFQPPYGARVFKIMNWLMKLKG